MQQAQTQQAKPREVLDTTGYEDKNIECKDCGVTFTFSAGEQAFYATKGLEHPPVRCPNCRKAKKDRLNNRR
jgi:ssDNA-binding Zn-finger/Zn-ribbon topoisomerase 1